MRILLLGALILALMTENMPTWSDVSPRAQYAIASQGITRDMYKQLARGKILTLRRAVPPSKAGVHVAAFAIVRAPVERLWEAISDCSRQPEFMPNVKSCELVPPNHPLPPNTEWHKLQLVFHSLFFTKKVNIIDQVKLEPPHYLHWKEVKGDLRTNEGYYRIIAIAPDIQLLIYDTLTDPGIFVPDFVQSMLVKSSLPHVVAALRNRAEATGDSARRGSLDSRTRSNAEQ
jgi:hypothetical protein